MLGGVRDFVEYECSTPASLLCADESGAGRLRAQATLPQLKNRKATRGGFLCFPVEQDAHFSAESSKPKGFTLSAISISSISLNANLSLSLGIAGRFSFALNNFILFVQRGGME